MDPARQTLKVIVLALLTMSVMAVDVHADCSGTCPDGYHSVCVERECKCRCSCVKKAAAETEVRSLLKAAGVTPQGIEAGVKRFNEELKSKNNFIIEFRDKEYKVIIRVSLRDESASAKVQTPPRVTVRPATKKKN